MLLKVNCKICLRKSAGLHECFGVFGWFRIILFDHSSSYKVMPNFHGLSGQGKIGQHSPRMNRSKIGHSYEAY